NESSEAITVTKEDSSGDTAIVLNDSAHVDGNLTIDPTGDVNFKLYDNDATCDDTLAPPVASESVGLDSSGDAATTVDYVTTTAHKYYWQVDYVGDDVYNGAELSHCHEAADIT
ncbi:MAG: hypothetical protein V7636_374, partial [Actinomycetota bacterium]